jgi:alpha-beta hydrolase superfamily lysophospholipase
LEPNERPAFAFLFQRESLSPAVSFTEHRFISFDETPVFYRHCEALGPVKAIVMIIHGMGEHGGRYQAFAEYLSAMGFECYLPDLRGFGLSGGKKACAREFSDFHKDLKALHSFIERNKKDTPIFILGHSFGGLITSSYLAFGAEKIKGIILSSPLFGLGTKIPFWRHWLGIAVSYVFPDHTERSTVRADLLTHDAEIMKVYKKDELIYHRVSTRLYRELVRMTEKKAQIASQLKIPVLVLQSGQDAIVSKEATFYFYDRLGSQDKEMEVFPEMYHEILNEIGRDRIFSKIGQWMLKRAV